MYRIPLSYSPIDVAKLSNVLLQYESRHHQEIILDFERQLSQLTGARYVVALNSGTAAIHLALKALQVERDDVVIAPTFTYVASVGPVLYQQAVPILVDSEAETWNIDPVLVERAIQESAKKPKAIVVVHNYGYPAKLEALKKISESYNIPILEDAAEALGSRYSNKHIGTVGDVGILSFNSNKVMTTYGGGALLTNRVEVFEKVLFWASQSREDKTYYEHLEVGYNYRMSPLNAAAGLAFLPGLEENVQKRRRDFQRYQEALAPLGCEFQHESAGYFSNRWFTTLQLPESCPPQKLLEVLKSASIETRFLWNPMHRQPLFKTCQSIPTGVSDALFKRGICLPSGNISNDQVDEIIHLAKALF